LWTLGVGDASRAAFGESSMPLRLSLFVYPLFAIAVAAGRGGVATPFLRARALSPETARKPASLSIRDVDAVRRASRRGILIDAGKGRYYVDEPRYRRQRRTFITILIGVGIVISGLMIIAFWF
jgi:hypothetical protein